MTFRDSGEVGGPGSRKKVAKPKMAGLRPPAILIPHEFSRILILRLTCTVRDLGHHKLSLDLDAVIVNGKRYSVLTYDVTRDGDQKDGVGANRRTGKFLGGGALFGTILGAVAGGGKGAGIGALAGGAAGAIRQIATRGKRVHIPAESVVTFQLQQPLMLASDHGFTRNGQHYHPL